MLNNNSDPNHPNIPGKLVFTAEDQGGERQVYTINANGSNLEKLTSSDNGHQAQSPSWHPSGQKIIFSSSKNYTTRGPSIWVMNKNGGNKHVLYDPDPDDENVFPYFGTNARWSPDGNKVVYDRCIDCVSGIFKDIFIFDTIDNSLDRITDDPATDFFPMWTADGQKIVFASAREYDNISFDLFLYDLSTQKLKKLNEVGNLGSFQIYGPDEVVFTKTSEFSNTKTIYAINLNTNSIRVLISNLKVNLLWVLASPKHKEMLTISKESEGLDIKIKHYNAIGEVIQQVELEKKIFANAKEFDWHFSEN